VDVLEREIEDPTSVFNHSDAARNFSEGSRRLSFIHRSIEQSPSLNHVPQMAALSTSLTSTTDAAVAGPAVEITMVAVTHVPSANAPKREGSLQQLWQSVTSSFTYAPEAAQPPATAVEATLAA
jgi:hypothetical protein